MIRLPRLHRSVPPLSPAARASRSRRLLAIVAWSGPLVLALAFLTPTLAQNQGTASGGLPYAPLMTRDQMGRRIEALRDRMPFVPGEALVKFRTGFASTQQLRALSALRGGATEARWVAGTLLVHADGEPNSQLMAEVLARQPEVEWAQPNYLYRLHLAPNDPEFGRQWNMSLINMPAAWDISHGASSSITVAVIDSGVTQVSAIFKAPLWTGGTQFPVFDIPFRQNPDIASTRFVSARDFVFWDGPVLDMVGHGTHVAGTVLQETNNNLGFAGIAYNARLMPLKVCIGPWEIQIIQAAMNIPGLVDPDDGGCAVSEVIAALHYAADSGAQVVNLSLGGPGESPAILDALRYAVQKGTFVAMSGGNAFNDGNQVEYPAGYGPRVDGAMTVAAVGRSRRRAYYSTTGGFIEIAAPGGDVRDGGLAGAVYQEGILDSDFDPTLVSVPRFDRYYNKPDQGTSMASPHIAGVAALLYAQGIKKPAAIEAAIKRFAVDLGPAGRDDEFGFGLVDARATLRGLGVAK